MCPSHHANLPLLSARALFRVLCRARSPGDGDRSQHGVVQGVVPLHGVENAGVVVAWDGGQGVVSSASVRWRRQACRSLWAASRLFTGGAPLGLA